MAEYIKPDITVIYLESENFICNSPYVVDISEDGVDNDLEAL